MRPILVAPGTTRIGALAFTTSSSYFNYGFTVGVAPACYRDAEMVHSGRSEVLAEAGLEILRHLADAVLAETAVRVHKPPAAELTHMQFRDPVSEQSFFLGEVLFYECIVELGGVRGYGYALGQDPERALYAAVVDAALNAGHPLGPCIEASLQKAAAGAAERRTIDARIAERTRVRFEVMEG